MNRSAPVTGRLLCIGFEGRECGAELRALLREVGPAGVIFFQRNIGTADQFRSLVAGIRETLKDVPPFLAIDQEGGEVDRFCELLGPLPSARAAAQAGLAYELGELAGRELAAFGLNVDFAPVLDIGAPESRTVLGSRIVEGGPEAVTRFAQEFLRGLGQWGVQGCGKHFPGLGAGEKDSHLAMPAINKTAEALWSEDIAPYRALCASPQLMPMVMVAHAWYPALEAADSIAKATQPIPATLSRRIVGSLLRERIGYPGMILSDDLEMGGVLEGRSMEQAAVESVRAGCDLLLVCRHAENVLKVHRSLTLEAERDTAFADLVRAAARRAVTPAPAAVRAIDLRSLRSDLEKFREAVELRAKVKV